ncbi:MAG: 5-methyltetrahydrofolate--homocysteine methyltransferase [Bacteroidales bacterium]|nr:5-methyltetrahydrofolate--homocysteine methyltransferase [Bacteroidales bacterium]
MDFRRMTMSDITLDLNEIYRSMGYPDPGSPAEDMKLVVEVLLERFAAVCHPQFRYIESTVEGLSPKGIIMKGLSGADKYLLFIATAGIEFQQEIDRIAEEGDIVKVYAADLIGSEIAEATVRECVKAIEADYAPLGVSNPYSPGYCGWVLSEQREIFSRFGEQTCGVKLNDSCLMYPIKSVSGIVSVGEKVEKREYGCAICGRKDCYKNRLRNIKK